MSTRSRISILNPDGKVRSIYCHWDGYLSFNGGILLSYYKDPANINKLMDLGDISVLGHTTNHTPDDWDYNKKDLSSGDKCLVYGDRGENCPAKEFESLTEFANAFSDIAEEYNYLYKDDRWYWRTDWDKSNDTWKPLTPKDCQD